MLEHERFPLLCSVDYLGNIYLTFLILNVEILKIRYKKLLKIISEHGFGGISCSLKYHASVFPSNTYCSYYTHNSCNRVTSLKSYISGSRYNNVVLNIFLTFGKVTARISSAFY